MASRPRGRPARQLRVPCQWGTLTWVGQPRVCSRGRRGAALGGGALGLGARAALVDSLSVRLAGPVLQRGSSGLFSSLPMRMHPPSLLRGRRLLRGPAGPVPAGAAGASNGAGVACPPARLPPPPPAIH